MTPRDSFDQRLAVERERLLRYHILKAWPLRGTPELRPQLEQLLDDYFHTAFLTVYERREARIRELVELMRETDPARLRTRDVEVLRAA